MVIIHTQTYTQTHTQTHTDEYKHTDVHTQIHEHGSLLHQEQTIEINQSYMFCLWSPMFGLIFEQQGVTQTTKRRNYFNE